MCSQLKTILAFALFFSFFFSSAQPNFLSNASFGLQGHYGSFLTSSSRSIYIKDSYSYFGELDLIKQTDGSKDWHHANGMPQWGFGILYGNSGSKKYIGNLSGALTFVDFRLLHWKFFNSRLRAGGGLGLVQKPYDIETNHKNLLLGTRANVLLNFLWKNEFRLSAHWHVNAGLSFTHLSNGKMKLPNLGLNVPAFSAGLRYALQAPVLRSRETIAQPGKKISLTIGTSVGVKQTPVVGGKKYLINVLTTEFNRQFAAFGKYGAGLFFSYDRSAGDHYADSIIIDKEVIRHRFNTAVYIAYEQLLGKFSVPVTAGYYLGEKYYGETFFQTFGIRYHTGMHWSAGLYLKNHFGHADYIHAGIGYQF